MPVYKYKDFKSAEESLWHFIIDDKYLHHLKELFHLKNFLLPLSHPKGIFKFKSIEDANSFREEVLLNNALKKKNYKATKSTT